MSLYVCQNPKCQAIENTALGGRNKGKTGYPNLSLMEMQGYGEDVDVSILEMVVDGKDIVTKKSEDVLMLCSECNTGRWHDEFEKTKASQVELDLAKTSKYSMITPFDHDRDRIVADDSVKGGYRLPTPTEIENKGMRRGRRGVTSPGTKTLVAGLMAMSGINLYSPSKPKLPKEVQSKKLQLAELKRSYKEAKRSNDIIAAKEIKEAMKKLKG